LHGAFREGFAAPGAALCQIALGLTFRSLLGRVLEAATLLRPAALSTALCDRLLLAIGRRVHLLDVFHFLAHKLAT